MQYNKERKKELIVKSFDEYPSFEPSKLSKHGRKHHYVVIPILKKNQIEEMSMWLHNACFTNVYEGSATTFFNHSSLNVAVQPCIGALSNLDKHESDTVQALDQIRLLFCVEHSAHSDFADRVEFDWGFISFVWNNKQIPLGVQKNRQILASNVKQVVIKNNKDSALEFMRLATPKIK